MKKDQENSEAKRQAKKYWKISAGLSVLVLLSLFVMAGMYNYYYEIKFGPEQPIPFSHRFHAGEKNISCLMCHSTATTSDLAGMPPLQTCMLCHRSIIINYPPIEKLRSHYFNNKPVEWNRVLKLPDFVYFSHRMHIINGIDCGTCHGNVKDMDRIKEAKQITMGFCIQCHRDNNATTDCFTCHR